MSGQPPTPPRADAGASRSRSTDPARVLVAGIAVSAAITLMAGMAAAGRSAPATTPELVAPQTGLSLAPSTAPPATTSRAS
ncbi:hypothetical protein HFP15_05660 [Amycolatopsis sp. K13G38]|uniref:Uncharacterized protein n=1 Tax=Amycolatopsis acididurans TaxID=2724524 RepID=A0ABX1IYY4_9PSEU|nr:hypothetical protein [Amycolatopsis acididurans]NKQ52361.1 hypothetical protein [Amycolatopsis acididurans]